MNMPKVYALLIWMQPETHSTISEGTTKLSPSNMQGAKMRLQKHNVTSRSTWYLQHLSTLFEPFCLFVENKYDRKCKFEHAEKKYIPYALTYLSFINLLKCLRHSYRFTLFWSNIYNESLNHHFGGTLPLQLSFLKAIRVNHGILRKTYRLYRYKPRKSLWAEVGLWTHCSRSKVRSRRGHPEIFDSGPVGPFLPSAIVARTSTNLKLI